MSKTEDPEFDTGEFIRLMKAAPARALLSQPVDRNDRSDKVEMVEESRAYRVDPAKADPNTVFIDGIQHAVRVASRDSRPVYLLYVAAGCVDVDLKPIARMEKVVVACAATDVDWILEICPHAPVRRLAVGAPPEIARHAHNLLGQMRDKLEKDLLEEVIDLGCAPIVVDGALYGRPVIGGLSGLAKTMNTQWMEDETILWTLFAGWRSPIFKIPSGIGHGADRYSCYTRLHNPSNSEWSHGLVRLESFEQEALESLCATAFKQRQAPGDDRRWDRHLRTVRGVEEMLRMMRPLAFTT